MKLGFLDKRILKYVFGHRCRRDPCRCIINNCGHAWPSGWQYLLKILIGKTTQDIDANEIIWECFKKPPKRKNYYLTLHVYLFFPKYTSR